MTLSAPAVSTTRKAGWATWAAAQRRRWTALSEAAITASTGLCGRPIRPATTAARISIGVSAATTGRVSTGVATVLSTATRTPAACASAQTAARSVTSHMGLAGVSTHSSRVRPGRIAAATAPRSVVSANSTSRPQVRANSASHFRTPQ